MSDLVQIYGLLDPRTDELKYVGKTTGTLSYRLRSHINDVTRGRVYIPRHRWIKDVLSNGEV